MNDAFEIITVDKNDIKNFNAGFFWTVEKYVFLSNGYYIAG